MLVSGNIASYLSTGCDDSESTQAWNYCSPPPPVIPAERHLVSCTSADWQLGEKHQNGGRGDVCILTRAAVSS